MLVWKVLERKVRGDAREAEERAIIRIANNSTWLQPLYFLDESLGH
jgi:hypothetical protein